MQLGAGRADHCAIGQLRRLVVGAGFWVSHWLWERWCLRTHFGGHIEQCSSRWRRRCVHSKYVLEIDGGACFESSLLSQWVKSGTWVIVEVRLMISFYYLYFASISFFLPLYIQLPPWIRLVRQSFLLESSFGISLQSSSSAFCRSLSPDAFLDIPSSFCRHRHIVVIPSSSCVGPVCSSAAILCWARRFPAKMCPTWSCPLHLRMVVKQKQRYSQTLMKTSLKPIPTVRVGSANPFFSISSSFFPCGGFGCFILFLWRRVSPKWLLREQNFWGFRECYHMLSTSSRLPWHVVGMRLRRSIYGMRTNCRRHSRTQ